MAVSRIAPPVLALLATGCFAPGDGREPPLDRIYFPVGVALSPGYTRMYVANSDFDLQFNAGSLQAYDLERLDALLPVYCGGRRRLLGGAELRRGQPLVRRDLRPERGRALRRPR